MKEKLLCVFGFLFLAAPVFSQEEEKAKPRPNLKEKWKNLSPEERERLRKRFDEFSQLPPEKRKRLLDQSDRLKQVPEKLRPRVKEWADKNFSPEERERLKALPEEQRRAELRKIADQRVARAKQESLERIRKNGKLPPEKIQELEALPPREFFQKMKEYRREWIRKEHREEKKPSKPI